jgi:PAS domain S-box-containing protein
MENFLKLFNNVEHVYYALSVLAILYTTYNLLIKKIKNSFFSTSMQLISQVPEKISNIKEVQSSMYSQMQLQYKIVNSILESLEIGQFVCDSNGDCIKVNGKWVSLTGLTESEALGHNWLLSVHPQDREVVQEKWINLIEHNNPFEEIFRYQHRITKEITKVKCTATDIFDDNHKRVFILGLSKVLGK